MKVLNVFDRGMTVLSPAKVNFFLHVTGKRADGYHDLFSLMCGVDLCDRMTVTFAREKTEVFCDHGEVPSGEGNIAAKAAAVFFRELSVRRGPGREDRGIRVEIEKRIPVGGGLGGGSSNAATVLMVMNRYYGTPFSTSRLMGMGAEIGADVPFFIFGKPAVASGIGDRLEACPHLKPYHLLLVSPGVHVSTAGVFKKLKFGLTKSENTTIETISNKYNGGLEFDALDYLENDLEPVTLGMHPEIAVIKEKLMACGAAGALMTGSGSTVFGLFSREEEARRARGVLVRKTPWRVFSARMLMPLG